jgi:hypothetical protein
MFDRCSRLPLGLLFRAKPGLQAPCCCPAGCCVALKPRYCRRYAATAAAAAELASRLLQANTAHSEPAHQHGWQVYDMYRGTVAGLVGGAADALHLHVPSMHRHIQAPFLRRRVRILAATAHNKLCTQGAAAAAQQVVHAPAASAASCVVSRCLCCCCCLSTAADDVAAINSWDAPLHLWLSLAPRC